MRSDACEANAMEEKILSDHLQIQCLLVLQSFAELELPVMVMKQGRISVQARLITGGDKVTVF